MASEYLSSLSPQENPQQHVKQINTAQMIMYGKHN